MAALLHDAAEAYVCDLVRPLKYSLPEYMRIEARIQMAIAVAFNAMTGEQQSKEIKAADNRVLMTERRDVMFPSPHQWSLAKDYPPIDKRIIPADPAIAAALFMAKFVQLKAARTRMQKEVA
jgi:5'-deoxynucleotidase YfbR-like HD superfamily hydrolase